MRNELTEEISRYQELCNDVMSVCEAVLQRVSGNYPAFEEFSGKQEYFQKLNSLFYRYPAEEIAVHIGKELLTHYTLEECLKGNTDMRDAKMYLAKYYQAQKEEKLAAQFTLLAFLEKLCYEHSNYSLVSAAGYAYEMTRYMESEYQKDIFQQLAMSCIEDIPPFAQEKSLLKLRRIMDLLGDSEKLEEARQAFLQLSEEGFDMESHGRAIRILYYLVRNMCCKDCEETLIMVLKQQNDRLEKLLSGDESEEEFSSRMVFEYENNRSVIQFLLQSEYRAG